MTEFLLMSAGAEEVGDQPRTQDGEASPQRAGLMLPDVTPRDIQGQNTDTIPGGRVVGHVGTDTEGRRAKSPRASWGEGEGIRLCYFSSEL